MYRMLFSRKKGDCTYNPVYMHMYDYIYMALWTLYLDLFS